MSVHLEWMEAGRTTVEFVRPGEDAWFGAALHGDEHTLLLENGDEAVAIGGSLEDLRVLANRISVALSEQAEKDEASCRGCGARADEPHDPFCGGMAEPISITGQPVLRADRIYTAHDRYVCGRARCAGTTAVYTGTTIGGAFLHHLDPQDVDLWETAGMGPLRCECGNVTAHLVNGVKSSRPLVEFTTH